MTTRKIRFPKPGETLLLDLLAPLGLSPQQMAERTSLSVDQIEGIIDGTTDHARDRSETVGLQ